MKSLQRVVWSEGMLMSPQHFQQQDLYHEAVVHERLAAVAPQSWGLLELELDVRALEAGQVALRLFAGVLPGGTVLRFRQGELEAPSVRAIEQHFPAHREMLEVHLGLPLERAGSLSYARSESERSRARYIVDGRAVLDTVSPDQSETIDFARRNAVILFGDEARDDYESVKLAEIVRDRSGKLCFSTTYIAPCAVIGAAPCITDGLRALLGACVAKRRAVADELRHRGTSVEYGPDEVTRFLALSALSGAIPLAKHFAETPTASPYQVYRFLLQFAGQLSAFSVDDDPAALPSYSHLDGRSTFQPLFAHLRASLMVAVASRVITIVLESRVDGMHLGRMQAPELLQPGVRFVLGVQAAVAEHTVYELVPRVAKIAAWSDIPRYLNAAVSTVALAACTRPPREVPVRPGKQYFLIDTGGPVWRALVHEQTIAVHLPPPFDPKSTVVELLAIPAA